jgi:hypothetical protein
MSANSYPMSPAVEALMGVLDELEVYLEQREDIRDGGDGTPLPNEEMSLLSDLRWWRSAAGLSSPPATNREDSNG